MKHLFVFLIRLYQKFISPALPPACRYTPNCSEYCAQALLKHGVVCGLLMGAARLLRCAPWGGYGYDPVPDKLFPRRKG